MILLTTIDLQIPTTTPPLGPGLAHKVLQYLGQKPQAPSLAALDALVTAYTRRVPWESASRIVKRANAPLLIDRPRWPAEFWGDAMRLGTGGTCFESNYAFFSLLRFLGYEGHLTINNMGETVGCHTAIVITLEGQPYLVDVGLPIYLPLPLDPTQTTHRATVFHTYSATPLGSGHYRIERDHHPRPDCFTLIDTPIEDATYRAATMTDYSEHGLFLDRVIVNRVVDGYIWRFASEQAPYQLEVFQNGEKTFFYLGDDPSTAAEKVARQFNLDETLLRTALQSLLVPVERQISA
ncbi:MAG: arylamine N-acetyltransferase [bacterium]|nr:arylamine N-acetyltransferase [bacterium]